MAACVAVVDDNRDLSMVLCEILADEGYRTLPVLAPDNALVVHQLGLPDLMDQHFGGTNAGVLLLRALRQDKVLASIPIVVCSADVLLINAHHDEFQRYGYCIVVKPFDIDDNWRRYAARWRAAPERCRNNYVAYSGAQKGH